MIFKIISCFKAVNKMIETKNWPHIEALHFGLKSRCCIYDSFRGRVRFYEAGTVGDTNNVQILRQLLNTKVVYFFVFIRCSYQYVGNNNIISTSLCYCLFYLKYAKPNQSRLEQVQQGKRTDRPTISIETIISSNIRLIRNPKTKIHIIYTNIKTMKTL